MKHIGYIYVLANSSMPGLVKVGKTTRTPTERAQELSTATGLPTPFIVVYEQLFDDCDSAESFVHSVMSKKGFRVSDNREFFNAPVNDVVRAIIAAPGAIHEQAEQPSSNEIDRSTSSQNAEYEKSELLSNENEGEKSRYPWSAILEEAFNNLFGWGDCIADEAEALRLCRQAEKLGSLGVYSALGHYYTNQAEDDAEELEIEPDYTKAIACYRDGARKGNAECYWKMGLLFMKMGNEENAGKCFSMFNKNFNKELPFRQHVRLINWDEVDCDICDMLYAKIEDKAPFPEALSQIISKRKQEIYAQVKERIKLHTEIYPAGSILAITSEFVDSKVVKELETLAV